VGTVAAGQRDGAAAWSRRRERGGGGGRGETDDAGSRREEERADWEKVPTAAVAAPAVVAWEESAMGRDGEGLGLGGGHGSEAEDLEAWVLMCGEEKGRRGPSQGRDGGTATATGAVS
jgi:hypothetical protein